MKSLRQVSFTFLSIALFGFGCATPPHSHDHAPAAAHKPSDWIVLFDGQSTDAWRGFQRDTLPDTWKVENGALATVAGGAGDIITKEQFENFELLLEWKISPKGNSGVMYHVSEEFKTPWQTGPEMQVLDDGLHGDGKNPKTSSGALYGLIAPKNKVLKPVGEWNQVRLLVQGTHAEHWLNGVKVVEYELGSPELAALIAASKFQPFPRFAQEKTGHICLQHHHDAAWFRNVKVRRLPSSASQLSEVKKKTNGNRSLTANR